jgi:hypothetical protein
MVKHCTNVSLVVCHKQASSLCFSVSCLFRERAQVKNAWACCGSFNDGQYVDHIAFNVSTNDELGRIWKEAVVA